MITLKLSKKIEKRLKLLSEKMGISVEDICHRAIEEFLEDQKDLDIALERLENPEGHYLSTEELGRELGRIKSYSAMRKNH